MAQSPRRGHPRRWFAVDLAAVLGVVAMLLSCGSDNPVGPPRLAPEIPLENTASKGVGKLDLDDQALSVADMLSDPLFQLLVQGVEEPSLAEPLVAAVDALSAGQTTRATRLLGKAGAAADALKDDSAAAEALLYWSALERYFSAAALM